MDLTWLDGTLWGNRISDYLVAAAALALGVLAVKIISFFIKRFKRLTEATANTFDDLLAMVLERIVLPVLYISCFYLAVKALKVPSEADTVINAVQMAVIAFFSARAVILFLGYALNLYLSKRHEDPSLLKSLGAMLNAVKFLVWALALIIFLDNIGFKVSAMLAGLGIGGIAVAIAAQTLLKDFFSYFSILFDRPFKLGDFIIIGDFMGTVEHIGINTTRLRSLSGELLIFSNADLTDSRVRNYQVMEKRRVVFRFGVTYQTPLERLREIPDLVAGIIKGTEGTSFDRAHFFNYGDSALVFEVVYFVLSSDYNRYMDIQQAINFSLKEAFEQRGIEFAYPTQTLIVRREG